MSLFFIAGYAVAQGTFDGKEMRYVSGAPRQYAAGKPGKDQGEVTIYEIPEEKKKYKGDIRTDQLKYNPNLFLRGDKSFSGFGSSLLVVDINNDK